MNDAEIVLDDEDEDEDVLDGDIADYYENLREQKMKDLDIYEEDDE